MRSIPPRGRFPNNPSRMPGPLPSPPPSPRWKVVLLGTAGQELTFVARAVMELTRFGDAEAYYRMWQAYRCGRANILETHFERGELYVEQFADRGLIAILEPA